ncbi:MAG TPA: VOC family protein [Methyloceanibacter sp.]|nr:VOC family protein [Methyloceanibacter sp.]
MSGQGNVHRERIVPALRYRDAAAAIDWLCGAFGFARKMVVPGDGGRVAHAELTLGNGMIMLGDAETEYGCLVVAPTKGESVTQGIYVVVEDVDAHYARAKTAGAEIVIDIKSQDYGGRDYTARDLEGHVRTFGSYDPWMATA